MKIFKYVVYTVCIFIVGYVIKEQNLWTYLSTGFMVGIFYSDLIRDVVEHYYDT